MSNKDNALLIPEAVDGATSAQELVRFWIADNEGASSLKVGLADPKVEPGMWGFILADIAKHVVQTLRKADPDGPDAQGVFEQIMQNFVERVKHNPELSAVVSAIDTKTGN